MNDYPICPAFVPFPKVPRLSREIMVTEKIDGTNASITITKGDPRLANAVASWFDHETGDSMVMLAGSRNRWITPESDNHGFAKWVQANQQELRGLGEGTHFGEWWGSGINRGYGYKKGEKFFSLFNASRWVWDGGENNRRPLAPYSTNQQTGQITYQQYAPACCDVVPILYVGPFHTPSIDAVLATLAQQGSVVSKGFMQPEGVIIYHTSSNKIFKKTLDGNDDHKHQ